MTELIKTKYNVVVPASNVQACHFIPSWPEGRKGNPLYKSVVIRFWNRKPDSAWSALVKSIVSGGAKEVPIFCNFQLTKKRNNLLFHLRKLKKEKKIVKYYTDENGKIQYKISEKSSKVTITYASEDKKRCPLTLSVPELLEKFN